MKSFDPTWRDWIKNLIQGGSVGIRVNGDISHSFQTQKGLRQGDPLSPMLFKLYSICWLSLLQGQSSMVKLGV
jgi:mannosylglycoprotein endo-beta-mannosidase